MEPNVEEQMKAAMAEAEKKFALERDALNSKIAELETTIKGRDDKVAELNKYIADHVTAAPVKKNDESAPVDESLEDGLRTMLARQAANKKKE